jgi:hypothetical protein
LFHLLHALRLSALGLALALAGCPVRPTPTELCDNGLDDDGDGFVDCRDGACAALPSCIEDCDDGLDNDQDGDADCADPDCDVHAACVEDCDNDRDDDGDGLVDCADSACDGLSGCVEDCANGLDDDGDTLIDCADPSCAYVATCQEDCADGVENNGDGRTDCEDPDCAGSDLCVEDCHDDADGDGDGLVDCADPDCDRVPRCQEDCDDGVDDNGAGLVDCEDGDCVYADACEERCANGVDDDGDGLVDCEDARCAVAAVCAEVCTNGVDDDGDGDVDCDDLSCAGTLACSTLCPEIFADARDPRCPGGVCEPDCVTPLAEVCDNGVDDNDDGRVDCDDVTCTWSSDCVEDCDNGADDDGDGWTDCQDPQCDDSPACVESCTDGGNDADGDGLLDCQEGACGGPCAQVETSYPNGPFYCWDNCEDPRCRLDFVCVDLPTTPMLATLRPDPDVRVAESIQTCMARVDANKDGVYGCGDPDCAALAMRTGLCNDNCPTRDYHADSPYDWMSELFCGTLEDCYNGLDDDGDGAIDAQDPNCPRPPPETCAVDEDADLDGAWGCEDPSCAGTCEGELCDNGVDDVGNGLVDCEDPACSDFPTCKERCDDGADGDGDGLVDAWDPDCPRPAGAWVARARLLGGRYWITRAKELSNTYMGGTPDGYRETDTVYHEVISLDRPHGEVAYEALGGLQRCTFAARSGVAGAAGHREGESSPPWREATFVAFTLSGLVTDCPPGLLDAALPRYLRSEGAELYAFEPVAGGIARRRGRFAAGSGAPYALENYFGDSPSHPMSTYTHLRGQTYVAAIAPGDWYYPPTR